MMFLRQINRLQERLMRWLLAIGFAGLIGVVFLQVFSRNVLQTHLIWTADLAQLLFAWCIFLGAALAFRWDAHYTLDILPARGQNARAAIDVVAHLAAMSVLMVLLTSGWTLLALRGKGISVSLGMSEFWFYLPIPVSAVLMLSFLIEKIADDLRAVARGGGPVS